MLAVFLLANAVAWVWAIWHMVDQHLRMADLLAQLGDEMREERAG